MGDIFIINNGGKKQPRLNRIYAYAMIVNQKIANGEINEKKGRKIKTWLIIGGLFLVILSISALVGGVLSLFDFDAFVVTFETDFETACSGLTGTALSECKDKADAKQIWSIFDNIVFPVLIGFFLIIAAIIGSTYGGIILKSGLMIDIKSIEGKMVLDGQVNNNVNKEGKSSIETITIEVGSDNKVAVKEERVNKCPKCGAVLQPGKKCKNCVRSIDDEIFKS